MVSAPEPAAVRTAERIRPSPETAYDDLSTLYDDGCFVERTAHGFRACTYGDRRGRRTVVLVGDSKAAQWFTPVDRIARRAGWRLVVMTKGGCEFADADRLVNGKRNPSCEAWAPRALRTIVKLRPDLVLTVTHYNDALRPGGSTTADYSRAAMVRGLRTYWKRVLRTGARVVPILDTPSPDSSRIPDCVRKNRTHLDRCSYDERAGVARSGTPAQRAAARLVERARPVSMTSELCGADGRCPPVIRGMLVYREGSHLTDTYAASTWKVLAKRLNRATRGAFDGR